MQILQASSYESSRAMGAMFTGPSIVGGVILTVFFIICGWKIFVKAGEEGWKSIIPIYSGIVMCKIVGKPWWWILLFLIPFVNFVIAIWLTNLLSKSFGKGVGFTVGLLLLGFIFYPILAFDRTIVYKGPAGDPTRFNPVNDDLNSIGRTI
ncbi:DUF5684 domain-containing protein [Chitinophaga sp.]|uniref:DUF5684 domain-containing protein n=1 Tax=Chitinophaga sp. TaxID=1869181 RepID=UPI002F9348DF